MPFVAGVAAGVAARVAAVVAAVTAASMVLGPVAAEASVPEIARFSALQSWNGLQSDVLPAWEARVAAVVSAPARPAPARPALARPATADLAVANSAVPSTHIAGLRTLWLLSTLSRSGIAEYMSLNPSTVGSLLASPPSPRSVSAWWSALSAQSRNRLGNATPVLVGNLEGIPLQVRDSANRTQLASATRELDAIISGGSGWWKVQQSIKQRKMLRSISDALNDALNDAHNDVAGDAAAIGAPPRRTLLTLDVTGQGRAAIVLGDLATADYVSYLVPGMFFTIENQMDDWVDAAARLYDQQRTWIEYFASHPSAALSVGSGDSGSVGSGVGVGSGDSGSGSVGSGDSGSGSVGSVEHRGTAVATVAWIGYHTPDFGSVGGLADAVEGSHALTAALEGLETVRGERRPYVTVIAHSYGSTAALMALTESTVAIDALAVVGSPGSRARSAAELRVRGGNVYVGEAAWDLIPRTAYFGSDPGSPGFGARVLGVSGEIDSITGAALTASIGHNEYFAPGTESMRNLALIGIGRGLFVTGGRPADFTRAFAAVSREP